jgi:amidase
MPMTIKDAIRMKDTPSTYGMWTMRNYRPKSDAKMIETLRNAGVVFLGRSAVPTGAFDWNCKNHLYAECVNPFDATRTPGGSSGGAAAALARGLTPLELGSDLGGSIRYPAHCCGVYGLRTTDGWLPVDDVGPEGFSTSFRQLVSFGPMTRYREDLELMLDEYSRAFPRPELFRSFPTGDKLRIAYSRELLGMTCEPETQAIYEAFLSRLETQGHHLKEARPDLDFKELYRVWGILAGHEYASLIPAIIRNPFTVRTYAWWILDRRLGKGPFTTYFKAGMVSTKKTYDEACEKRKQIFQSVDQFFDNYALWILPVAPSPAIPLALSGKKIKTPQGIFEYSKYLGSYTVPTTTLGTPVLTCPIGADHAGLPIGVQLHGPRYSDLWLSRIAETIVPG